MGRQIQRSHLRQVGLRTQRQLAQLLIHLLAQAPTTPLHHRRMWEPTQSLHQLLSLQGVQVLRTTPLHIPLLVKRSLKQTNQL
mgnify:CR=1 FL=1